jgi:hypothetical protein
MTRTEKHGRTLELELIARIMTKAGGMELRKMKLKKTMKKRRKRA